MNFYKIENGQVIVGSGDELPAGFIEYTEGSEPQELVDALKVESDAIALASFKQTILAEITKTDVTMARIQQGVILGTCAYTNADVVAFVQYIKDLRGLLSATAPVDLPVKPPYPAGT